MSIYYDEEEIAHKLEQLTDNPEDFNDWELKFIDSVFSQFENGRTLSEKQVNVIERLYQRVPKDDDYAKEVT